MEFTTHFKHFAKFSVCTVVHATRSYSQCSLVFGWKVERVKFYMKIESHEADFENIPRILCICKICKSIGKFVCLFVIPLFLHIFTFLHVHNLVLYQKKITDGPILTWTMSINSLEKKVFIIFFHEIWIKTKDVCVCFGVSHWKYVVLHTFKRIFYLF